MAPSVQQQGWDSHGLPAPHAGPADDVEALAADVEAFPPDVELPAVEPVPPVDDAAADPWLTQSPPSQTRPVAQSESFSQPSSSPPLEDPPPLPQAPTWATAKRTATTPATPNELNLFPTRFVFMTPPGEKNECAT
jgi:hypothetical protein